MTATKRVAMALLALGLGGCPGPGSEGDAARHDAAPVDAAVDAGVDAGTNDDAGALDAATRDAPTARTTGTIVPLYTDPSDATWATIAAAAAAHPSVEVIAIINPNSGPTPSADPAYAAGIAALQRAGVIVVAYVATGYGTRAEADVAQDVDLYAAQYPSLDGIFFDEAAIDVAGHESVYAAESAHARGAGYGLLIANPGTTPSPAYDALFDVALVYESDGLPSPAALAGFAPRRAHAGIIPYAVAALDAAYVASIRPDVQYVYVTDDDLPNPWDTLPAYFDGLLAALE